MTSEPEEPKLIIDEDYKSQVEREKAEAEAKRRQAEATAPQDAGEQPEPATDAVEPASAEAAEATSESESAALPPPPRASFPLLITSLATQAIAAMGQLPDPEGQALPPNADYARHFIDLVGMLEDKTRGNLSDEESRYVQETLHQLRMMFVEFNKAK